MVDWINEDGTFAEGFEKNLPEEVRSYAKDAKDVVSLIKRGADTQREFHTRVKLPTDDEGRQKFLDENFKDYLDARNKAAETEAAQAKEEAEAAAKKDADDRLAKAKEAAKALLGDKPDVNVELCRRAFRGDHCPAWVKDGIAQHLGVEVDKIADDQFKEVLSADPAIVQTLLSIGNLIKDGRTVTGDGHRGGQDDEKLPLQPKCPGLYKSLPDSDPEKKWFINRGYNYQTNTWDNKPM